MPFQRLAKGLRGRRREAGFAIGGFAPGAHSAAPLSGQGFRPDTPAICRKRGESRGFAASPFSATAAHRPRTTGAYHGCRLQSFLRPGGLGALSGVSVVGTGTLGLPAYFSSSRVTHRTV